MRKLVAALACRNTSNRLFGKPMQNLDDNKTILDELVNSLKQRKIVKEICLGISEGISNSSFKVVMADKLDSSNGVGYALTQCRRIISLAPPS